MSRFKDFDQFNESSEFNWKDYGEKRELVMDVLPKLINRIRPLDEFGKRMFQKIAHNELGGSYMTQLQRKYGYNADMMHEIYNQMNSFKSYVGPNLAGEFKMVKATIWDKIFGTKSMRVVKGSSIIDNLMGLVPEFHGELKKSEEDLVVKKMVDEIWAIHPNNPKNKEDIALSKEFDKAVNKAVGQEVSDEEIDKDYESDETREDVERQTKQLHSAIKKIRSPFGKMEESRKDWYDEEEWEWQGETRKSLKPNDNYFKEKAKNYKQMMINLSNMVLKYKQDVIDALASHLDYIDKKAYNNLLASIDKLYNYINGDSSKVKGVKTRLQYSIVEMLDKYINKDNTNYKTFF